MPLVFYIDFVFIRFRLLAFDIENLRINKQKHTHFKSIKSSENKNKTTKQNHIKSNLLKRNNSVRKFDDVF